MNLTDLGHGTPVVVLPGIQGRWQWHWPGIASLGRRCRVLTFSYADEPSSGIEPRPDAGIAAYCEEVITAMNQAGIAKAVICGISYGGLIAAVFAARYPELVSGLVLVSALPPTWRPDARIARYLRWPTLMTPLFMAASARMYSEIRRAAPNGRAAAWMSIRHACRALAHMFSPRRMARRAATVAEADVAAEIRTVTAPTLIIVGDAGLDRVVPVAGTLEYRRWLPHAQVVTLEHTGHLGCVTRPDAFADLIHRFVTRIETGVGVERDSRTSADTRKRLG